MKLTTMQQRTPQSVLIYGPPKTGKTELVGKLSEKFNLEYFGLENGHSTLFKLPLPWQERINVYNIPDTRSYPIAIESCLKIIKGNSVDLCEEHGKVSCSLCKTKIGAVINKIELNALGMDSIVIFDSLTQLTNSAIAHITKGQTDDYKLNYDDWGNLGKLMEIFLSHLQQAKFHVICISHETEAELEDGKIKIVPTAGTRNFSRNVAKYFGHVVYCQVANKKHTFNSSTTSYLNVVVGSRTDVDVGKMVEPSLLPIFEQANSMPIKDVNKTNGQIALEALKEKHNIGVKS